MTGVLQSVGIFLHKFLETLRCLGQVNLLVDHRGFSVLGPSASAVISLHEQLLSHISR